MSALLFSALVSELHQLATEQTGLRHFGAPSYLASMHALAHAFDNDTTLTPSGWRLVHDLFFLDPLISRLYTERSLARHNDLAATRVTEPIIITGLPRTGSTALHRLLALDPQFHGLPYWLARTPMPRPPTAKWDTYAEYRACVARINDMFAEAPDAYDAHPFTAGDIEECGTLLYQEFCYIGLHSVLPSYDRWLRDHSPETAYRRYLDTLRVIASNQPQKPWILKYPYHLAHLSTLVRLVPDARIILTHRDPLKAIPSFCHLIHTRRQLWEGDCVSVREIGPAECDFWHDALTRAQEVRSQRPSQFFDVEHYQFTQDPMGTVRSIYRHFDLALSPDVEELFKRRLSSHAGFAAAPQNHHPQDFGLTDSHIASIFSEYRREHRFGYPTPSKHVAA